MFGFGSSSKESSSKDAEWSGSTVEKVAVTMVMPDPGEDDFAEAQRELSAQRIKWGTFLKKNKDIWHDDWIWQSRRTAAQDSNSQIKKKILQIFSPRVQTQKQLKGLIRGGVPPELRGRVWFSCSGAGEKRAASKDNEQYEVMIGRSNELDGTLMEKDIEKDLMRTFPERMNQEGQGETIISLRRVLRAYALRNTTVGYCQSMNYLCALLLFHMNEEQSFWTLACLIEDILPDNYYSPSLLGGRVDQQVFQACLAWKMPKLYAVLKETNTMLEPIVCPWFLCVFINVLPLPVVCRVWDCLFWEGDMVLFRIGMTMIRSKTRPIMESDDFIGIYSVLKSSTTSAYSFELESKETSQNPNYYHDSFSAPTSPGGTGTNIGGDGDDEESSSSGTAADVATAKTRAKRTKAATLDSTGIKGKVGTFHPEDLAADDDEEMAGGANGDDDDDEHDDDEKQSTSKFTTPGRRTYHGTGSFIGSGSRSSGVSLSFEQAPISKTEFLIQSAFGFRWLKSVPQAKVQLLREKFLGLLEGDRVTRQEQQKKKQAEMDAAREKKSLKPPPKPPKRVSIPSGQPLQEVTQKPGPPVPTAGGGGGGGGGGGASSSGGVTGLASPPVPPTAAEEGGGGDQAEQEGNQQGGEGEEDDDDDVPPSSRNTRATRSRQSTAMLMLLEGLDVNALRELALEMDEGLGDSVEEFARELGEEEGRGVAVAEKSSPVGSPSPETPTSPGIEEEEEEEEEEGQQTATSIGTSILPPAAGNTNC